MLYKHQVGDLNVGTQKLNYVRMGTVSMEEGEKKEETKEDGRCQCKHNCVHCGTATRSEGEGKEKNFQSW